MRIVLDMKRFLRVLATGDPGRRAEPAESRPDRRTGPRAG